jgi:hypothetical protein
MPRYPYRLNAIAPVAVAEILNDSVEMLGIGPRNFSVELNAAGDDSPATHLGLSGLLSQALVDNLAGGLSTTPGVRWWRCDNGDDTIQTSSDADAVVGAVFTFEDALAAVGLKRRTLPMGAS